MSYKITKRAKCIICTRKAEKDYLEKILKGMNYKNISCWALDELVDSDETKIYSINHSDKTYEIQTLEMFDAEREEIISLSESLISDTEEEYSEEEEKPNVAIENTNNNNKNKKDGKKMMNGNNNNNGFAKMAQLGMMQQFMNSMNMGGNAQSQYVQAIDQNGQPVYDQNGQPVMQMIQGQQAQNPMSQYMNLAIMQQFMGEGEENGDCGDMFNGMMEGFDGFKMEKLEKGKVKKNFQNQLCYRNKKGKYISYNGKDLKQNMMIMPSFFESFVVMPCPKEQLRKGDLIIIGGEGAFVESVNPYKICSIDGIVQESKSIVNEFFNLEIVSVVRDMMEMMQQGGGMQQMLNPMQQMFGGVMGQPQKKMVQVKDINGNPAFYPNGQPIMQEIEVKQPVYQANQMCQVPIQPIPQNPMFKAPIVPQAQVQAQVQAPIAQPIPQKNAEPKQEEKNNQPQKNEEPQKEENK